MTCLPSVTKAPSCSLGVFHRQVREKTATEGILCPQQKCEHEIKKREFNDEIPDGLTRQEKGKEQDHPRIGGEKIQPSNQRFALLPVGFRDRGFVSLRDRPFEIIHPWREPFLLSRVVQIEPEQKFLPRLILPAQAIKFRLQCSGRIQFRTPLFLGEIEPGVPEIIRRRALQRMTRAGGEGHEPDELRAAGRPCNAGRGAHRR